MRRLKTLSAVVTAAMVAVTTAAAVAGATPAAHAGAVTHLGDLTSSAPVTVVASGLDEPRNLAWGPHGHLLVSEAGTPDGVCDPTGTSCYGLTGSIADISSGTPVPVVTGLPSALSEQEVVGPDALAYVHGRLYTLETGAPQELPSWLPASLAAQMAKQFGALLNISHGRNSVVANVGSADYQWSQAHLSLASDFPDADPYGLTADPRGGFYTVDAASNTLDSVDIHGHVQVLAFIPNTPAGTDGVPTCLAVGPDGAVYVGQLTGHGNSATAANVYRYSPRGGLTVWQSGFSAINGCGFGANGDFYVTELDTTGFLPTGAPDGVVIQISKDGTRTVLGAGKLLGPSGFLAGPDGSIYVANNSLIWPPYLGPGNTGPFNAGQVVKIG